MQLLLLKIIKMFITVYLEFKPDLKNSIMLEIRGYLGKRQKRDVLSNKNKEQFFNRNLRDKPLIFCLVIHTTEPFHNMQEMGCFSFAYSFYVPKCKT